MTTYVQIAETDEDLATQLADLVTGLKYPKPEQSAAKAKECKTISDLAVNHHYEQVIKVCILENIEVLISAPQPKDAIAAFNICFHLLHHMEAKRSIEISTNITDALKTNTKNPQLSLRLLGTLFNLLEPKSSLRYTVFVAVLDTALKSGQASTLSGQFGNLEKWASDWALSPEDTADLFFRASEVCKTLKQFDERYKLLLQYLKTQDKADFKASKLSKEIVVEVAVQAIKSKNIYECDQLLKLKAIERMKDDKRTAPIYTLLSIVSTGDVASLMKFRQEQPNFGFADFTLNEDDLLRKMRALTLCTIGEEVSQLTYKEIQDKLQVSAAEVEQTVIDIVVAGLIDAKIDQENQTILIQRVTPRVFTKDNWAHLGQQLGAWKRNLRTVISTLTVARQSKGF